MSAVPIERGRAARPTAAGRAKIRRTPRSVTGTRQAASASARDRNAERREERLAVDVEHEVVGQPADGPAPLGDRGRDAAGGLELGARARRNTTGACPMAASRPSRSAAAQGSARAAAQPTVPGSGRDSRTQRPRSAGSSTARKTATMATASPENSPSATRTPPIAGDEHLRDDDGEDQSRDEAPGHSPASRSAIRTPGRTSNAPKTTMASAERPTARTSSIMASDTEWPGRGGPGRRSTGRVTPGSGSNAVTRNEVDVGEPADRRRRRRRPSTGTTTRAQPGLEALRRTSQARLRHLCRSR